MKIIIGNAWPYANGALHLGRIAVLLPGDILARYHRLMGDDVVFVSGTDCHGTPVTTKAKAEGIKPVEAVRKYHSEFEKCFRKLNFSFDIFAKTHCRYHEEKVKSFVLEMYNKRYIYEKNIDGENHLFFALSKFEKDIKELISAEDGWRENAKIIANRYLLEGLRDRVVTRKFNWGIDVPLEGYEDKKIFVWIEAVMGYLTASMKCLEERGEDWKEYWGGEDSRLYFVHGKDNIPFHTILFPAIIQSIGISNLNMRIISSEHLKLEGKNFSTTKNWAIWADYITDNYNVDVIRYFLALNSPEVKDTDFTWRNFVKVNNNLVDVFGNFVNRTLIFIKKNFNSKIPNAKMPKDVKEEIWDLYFGIGDKIEEGKFKNSLEDIFMLIEKYNRYFDEQKPWISVGEDKKKCAGSIYICAQIIANVSNLLSPFMPSVCEKIRKLFGIENPIWSYIEISDRVIGDVEILFERIDKKNIINEVQRLKLGKS